MQIESSAPNSLSCIFKFIFFSSVIYPKCLSEMTSIKSVGARFVEDNGPHHVVTLEAELPRTLSKCCWEADGVSWPSRGVWGWTKARASCSANPSEIGLNPGRSVWSGLDFKLLGFFFPHYFFSCYSIASAKIFSGPADPLWSKNGAGVLLLVGGFTPNSVHRLDPLLTSMQVEGIKRPILLVYNFIHLNIMVYDRIQSNQLYIHREAQN